MECGGGWLAGGLEGWKAGGGGYPISFHLFLVSISRGRTIYHPLNFFPRSNIAHSDQTHKTKREKRYRPVGCRCHSLPQPHSLIATALKRLFSKCGRAVAEQPPQTGCEPPNPQPPYPHGRPLKTRNSGAISLVARTLSCRIQITSGSGPLLHDPVEIYPHCLEGRP